MKRLDILVLHGIRDLSRERQTSINHLFALERYTSGHRFVYHFIADQTTDALKSIPFDVIVLDVTFLCWRWGRPRELFDAVRQDYKWIGTHGALVAAFPQDDYDHSLILDEWLVELNTGLLFTVYETHRDALYPNLIARGTPLVGALTGYIDEDDIGVFLERRIAFREREIDVSYRVRRLPVNFGRFGRLKSEFGRAFALAAAGRFVCDISDDPKDALYGSQWPGLLGNSRFVLGAEGGSSVIDRNGEIRLRIEEYLATRPDAEFEEIATACLRPEDESKTFAVISPRLFEIAMAGACPILLEGAYNGLIQPNLHYIPVKRDFSNIEDVVERLADLDAAEQMAKQFEEAILGNPSLRYQTWIPGIMEVFGAHIEARRHGDQRAGALSDREFSVLREQHQSAVRLRLAREIAEVSEKLRLLGNEAQSQRLRLESENQRLESENRRLAETASKSFQARLRRLLGRVRATALPRRASE